MAVQVWFDWDADGVSTGVPIELGSRVRLTFWLKDTTTGTGKMFLFPGIPGHLMAGSGTIKVLFSRLGLYCAGTVTIYVDWQGEALPVKLTATGYVKAGDPVPARILGYVNGNMGECEEPEER